MASTLTLLADHLGSTYPRVSGIEYVVDAVLEITDYAVVGEVLNASDFGLGTITQAMICGYESAVIVPKILLDSSGNYTSTSSITVLVQNPSGSTADEMALGADGLTDLGFVRLRVYGQLA